MPKGSGHLRELRRADPAATQGSGERGSAMTSLAWAALAAGTAALLATSARELDPLATPCTLEAADRAHTPSHGCIACHDGTAGPLVSSSFRSGWRGHGGAHPVDVYYGDAWTEDARHFVPEPMIPSDVPLVDGRVACTSCHDGASPFPRHVVDPVRLCQACHVK